MAKRRLPEDLDLGDVMATPGAARPQAAFHEKAPADPERVPGPDLKARAINMSIYILPDDHRRLRQLAAGEDTSIQALVLDGIDRILQERGQEPVERWQPRRKVR